MQGFSLNPQVLHQLAVTCSSSKWQGDFSNNVLNISITMFSFQNKESDNRLQLYLTFIQSYFFRIKIQKIDNNYI